ncbi:MAG: cyclic nucleotide-binding domain-containing protein [Fibrobacterota bacterium]
MDILYASIPAKAFWFGILSAASLPIGALLGIYFPPRKRVVAALMAFGAGCLLCALTLELVAPAFKHAGFYPLAVGAVIGGVLFVVLNKILNGQGAFLRKPATFLGHLVTRKKARMKALVEQLSRINIIAILPTNEMRALLPFIHSRTYAAGTLIFRQGEKGDALYLIDAGEVEVVRDSAVIATLPAGESFGEMALLSGEPRNASLRAKGEVRTWRILKQDFDHLLASSPALVKELKNVSEKRLDACHDAAVWRRQVEKFVEVHTPTVTESDAKEAVHAAGGGVALAIWLGLLLDGIPESAVIGASMAQTAVSWALIAGLFLSNLPEAMSSAVGMRRQGMPVRRVLGLWGSLMLITGVGALLGNFFFTGASHVVFAGFEGCAAGAMLVMIAETMLPEAYEQGGAVTGLATLLGFLSGLFVKSFA